MHQPPTTVTMAQALAWVDRLHAEQRHAEAEQLCQRALASMPDHLDALQRLARSQSALNRHAEAAHTLDRLAERLPQSAAVQINLGTAQAQVGQTEAALQAFDRAADLEPDSPLGPYGRGLALSQSGQESSAVQAYRHALSLQFDFVPARTNLVTLLNMMNRPGEALAVAEQTVQIAPSDPLALNNLGATLLNLNRLDAAEAAFCRAIDADPDYFQPHHNLSAALLLQGQWQRGWAEMEWRCHDLQAVHFWKSEIPAWNGAPLPAGQTLAVFCEQGLGDTLQFVRLLPLVRQRAMPGEVLLVCQPALLRLLEHSFPQQKIIPWDQPPHAQDARCMLLSTAGVLGFTPEVGPVAEPYIRPIPAEVQLWHARLAGLGTSRNVGLVWAGNPSHRNDRNRSIRLAQLAPLAGAADTMFVSLQKNAAATELTDGSPGWKIHDFTAELGDMADTAALVSNLDLVITVDTSIAHLAGAMGKPVWVLLSFAPDWRWQLSRPTDTPWYPTMRLFRQPAPGDWSGAIAQVAAALGQSS